MQTRALGTLRRAGTTFSAFSTPQKLIAAIGLAVLVLGGFAFARWASTPTMTPLFTNLASEDASAIVDQLDSQSVPYEIADGGASVLVPREDVYRLRLSMSAAGLPSSGDTGYALLDEQGVTASQFQQQVTWQRALEGELASTIGSISGVEATSVHLAIPQDDVFLDETAAPTASVLVQSSAGGELTAPQVQSIVNLVASSVEGMDANDVTVVDGDGNLLSAAGSGAGGASGVRDQQTTDYESRLTGTLQGLLDQVVGPGHGVATVTADLDFDDVQRTSETYTEAEGVRPITSSSSTETYGSGAAGAASTGVLGPDNIAVPSGEASTSTDGTTTSADGGYSKVNEVNNNPVNKVVETNTPAAGSVNRQSVAVVIDTEAAAKVDMTNLTEILTAAAGLDAERGDTISVQQMVFDTSAAESATAQLDAAKEGEAAAQRTELIRTGSIAGIVLLIVIAAIIASLRRRKGGETQPIDIGELQAVSSRPEIAWDADADGNPVAVHAALPSSPSGGGATAVAQRLDVNELVERQPDDVAELLRGWLADRRS